MSESPPAVGAGGGGTREATLEERSQALAAAHRLAPRRVPAHRFDRRLRGLAARIREIYALLPRSDAILSPGHEWLYDNDYLVLKTLRQVAEDMPKPFYRSLPKLVGGEARVETLGRENLAWSGGRLESARLQRGIDAYQQIAPLTLGELWALPTFLRIAALERLAVAAAPATEAPPPPEEREIVAAITTLHEIERQDWTAMVEALSRVERCLKEDPAGAYERMDAGTRDRYRKAIEHLALRSSLTETEVAEAALQLAREAASSLDGPEELHHIGSFLVGPALPALERRIGAWRSAGEWARRQGRRWSRPLYLLALALVTVALLTVGLGYAALQGARASLLLLLGALAIPAWMTAEVLVHYLVTHLVAPRPLPKLDFDDGIPEECRTLVVIPALLSNVEEIAGLFAQLERHRAANPDPHLAFALLSDFVDAPFATMPEDAARLERAESALAALRERHPETRFYLLHRERRWNPSEGCWMGWERKRGKLVELDRRILHGERGTFRSVAGDPEDLSGFRYVITLDSDTLLPPGAAAHLVGTLAHPLNRPRFDAEGRLRRGFTVLQPRIDILPASANRTRFSRAFSGSRGVDLYSRALSDPYMDLFGEGIYVGKGIYDVAAFARSFGDKVPENAILSHDLFEGGLGRAGLVSDVSLFESYPSSYLAYSRRLDRWIRGDWQLWPWLARRVPAPGGSIPNPLSWVTRWVIRQNLLRSLLAPSLLLLLVLDWLLLPGGPTTWTLLAVFTSALPFLLGGLDVRRQLLSGRHYVEPTDSSPQLFHWLSELAFLPHASVVAASAIGRTLWRLKVSHRHLLQWPSALPATATSAGAGSAAGTWREMRAAPLLALALALLVATLRPAALPIALPFLVIWLLSPQLAFVLSRSAAPPDAPLTDAHKRRLATIARRTWFYFERFVGPEDHWLPPDHFQEQPRGTVAHRTSPTNIGLLLAATLGAYDFGFVDARTLLQRLGNSFATLRRLEHHRGHLLNWYDTQTLRPLPPRYVSTVDSGNMLACMLAVAKGCLEVPGHRVLPWERWHGLLVLLDLLGEVAGAHAGDPTAVTEAITRLRSRIEAAEARPQVWPSMIDDLLADGLPELEGHLVALGHTALGERSGSLEELAVWSTRLRRHLQAMRRERDVFLPWLAPDARFPELEALLGTLPTAPSFRDLGVIYPALLAALAESDAVDARRQGLRSAVATAERALHALHADVRALADEAERYLHDTGFDFLFDRQRKIFHTGYSVDDDRRDPHAYDLLASEARIGSFLAIVLGRVPAEHWLHLGRPLGLTHGTRILLSWSGTMFEYLMPTLFMRTPPASLLGQSCRAAVARQIAFGEAHGVPWGVSESGYARTDAQQSYQYRAFGVPDLALSHAATDAVVIAPYASILALPFAPRRAVDNLERLAADGALGRYGFYEALDFTPAHLPLGRHSVMVRSYMAHHHGMSFIALVNTLLDDRFVERFHADLRVQSGEILLHEEPARALPLERPRAHGQPRAPRSLPPLQEIAPWDVPARTPTPQLHSLSNGRYTLFMSNAGGGSSRWRGVDLTRWRSDATRDAWGQWLYLQDLDSGRLLSATRQPTGTGGQDERLQFHPHRIEVHRRHGDITTHLDLTVPPDDDLEIRRLTVVNHGHVPRRLAFTSYGEVVLARHEADLRHPAFGKLFIESSWDADVEGLLFRRRPREATEAPHYLLHRLIWEQGDAPAPEYETDRARFLGRYGRSDAPAALWSGVLSGTTGATLDPIFALRASVTLEPHGTVRLAYLTLAARSRHALRVTAQRYRHWSAVEAAFDAAREAGMQALAQLELDPAELATVQALLSRLLYPDPALRAAPSVLRSNRRGPSGLWVHAISGDHPVLLARLRRHDDLDLVGTLLKAHRYWREQGFTVDLVLLNEHDSGYLQTLQDSLRHLLGASGNDAWLERPGGIFPLMAAHLDETDLVLLEASARVVVGGTDSGTLELIPRAEEGLPPFTPTRSGLEAAIDTAPLPRPEGLRFDNGFGGFSEDGREYLIYLDDRAPPAPWINVLANPDFGSLVSESGASTTWAVNSGENRLTPWSNDPVSDPSGEVLYLRDEETAAVWSPTPQPAPDGLPYLVRHGAGYTCFEHHSHGLKQRLRLFVPGDAPVKVARLRLENLLSRPRRLTVTYYAEWVLGNDRELSGPFVIPEYDVESGALLARNPYQEDVADQVAFLAADRSPHGLTTDRREFLGREGSLRHPAALGRIGLSGRVEAGRDPCAALQLHIDLPAGGSDEVSFLLGAGANGDVAREHIRGWRDPARLDDAWEKLRSAWDERLGAIGVTTPDPAMDVMLNRWLLYQTLACRLWARSAFYQSSGAFGFRDQLQDGMALLHAEPGSARAHLLRAARHQFEGGDVLHWWHPPHGQGVRTRISDDLVWLPFTTAHYLAATGDRAVLDERVPYLQGRELDAGEAERYDRYAEGPEGFTLYEHGCRALERAATAGEHGLPLMGGGDWNDGMNHVGIGGKGESVWLAWFLIATLEAFAPLCTARGDVDRADRYRQQAEAYRRAVETHAWDGDWYLRAFFDDGTPLGSRHAAEAQIDAVAQAWAALSGAASPERTERAMAAVAARLVRSEDGLVLLLAPPFDRTGKDPGYIKGYLPGVRENGGQYTHAALWVAWAFATLGDGDRAHALFELLNPIRHGDSPEAVARYKVEPYVVAADVYGVAPHVGRGGWSWYTGSAAWMYRLGTEALLGIRRRGETLEIDPCIPRSWPGFEVRYPHGAAHYRIRVENPDGVSRGVGTVTVDGILRPDRRVPLVDDGRSHEVEVRLAAP